MTATKMPPTFSIEEKPCNHAASISNTHGLQNRMSRVQLLPRPPMQSRFTTKFVGRLLFGVRGWNPGESGVFWGNFWQLSATATATRILFKSGFLASGWGHPVPPRRGRRRSARMRKRQSECGPAALALRNHAGVTKSEALDEVGGHWFRS